MEEDLPCSICLIKDLGSDQAWELFLLLFNIKNNTQTSSYVSFADEKRNENYTYNVLLFFFHSKIVKYLKL